jgi:amino-acid N-acetyltransferase
LRPQQRFYKEIMNQERFTYHYAASQDLAELSNLLQECGLPFEDIAGHLPHFILAKDGAKLIASIGLEALGDVGLLRSLAVSPQYRGQRIAEVLCERLEGQAQALGIESLYLLTLTAEGFFQKRSYVNIERQLAPPAIQNTEEFKSICPASSVCMKKEVKPSAPRL